MVRKNFIVLITISFYHVSVCVNYYWNFKISILEQIHAFKLICIKASTSEWEGGIDGYFIYLSPREIHSLQSTDLRKDMKYTCK